MLTDLLRAIRLPKKVQDEPSPKLILTWAYGVIASSSGSSCPWLDALSSIDKLTILSLSGRVSCCPCSDSTSSIQTYCLSIYRWDEPRLSQPFCPGITHHPHEQPFLFKKLSVKQFYIVLYSQGCCYFFRSCFNFFFQDIDWVQTEKHVFEQASNHPFLVGLHSCFQTESRWDVSNRNGMSPIGTLRSVSSFQATMHLKCLFFFFFFNLFTDFSLLLNM